MAGFTASGQLADWSTTTLITSSITSSITTAITHFDYLFDYPLRLPTSITHTHQSDHGGLHSFRTTGRPVIQPSQSPLRSIIHSQSDRGGLRLQDNRQTGEVPISISHFNKPYKPF
ncbi:hypothetical protein PENCOP_c002G06448 [Penicillium coprophilum]|uniref:Uncharacterized protein n=1 Tax=Penicillium coprophilum TaxID=36646 RepID=A0A1V6V296_9EURO|nr:hypothetical protein PENCOP_c002G06448 [Penicillium coprophilum]